MVEVKRAHASAIAADAAASTSLGDQDRLHLPASASDGVRPALLAPVVPAPVDAVLGLAMAHTTHAHGGPAGLLRCPRLNGGSLAATALGFQAYLINQCLTVALLRPTDSAIWAIDMPACTS